MIVTGRQVRTVGGMWKNFPTKLLQLLTSGSYRVYFIALALQGVTIAISIDSDALGYPVYQQRSTMIEEQCQHHLTSVGNGATLFRSEDYRCFHC